MMTDIQYTIQELSELSGVPRRTIHFYTQQGIIPPPQSAGLAARYSTQHLTRLLALPVLRRRGLRLDEIRAAMDKMDFEALQSLISQATDQETKSPKPVSLPVQQTIQRFIFPGGIEISAPTGLPPADRRRLESLIQSARQIFTL